MSEGGLKTLWWRHRLNALARRHAVQAARFTGRSVAVIGPAESSIEFNEGPRVEAHDLIVRFNSAFRLTDKYRDQIGFRTDILAHNLTQDGTRNLKPIEAQDLSRHQTRLVLWPTPKEKKIRNFTAMKQVLEAPGAGDCRIEMVPPESYRALVDRLGGQDASVGLASLAYLLGTDVAKIYVSGFSFFSTPYADGYNSAVRTQEETAAWAAQSKHDFQSEARVFADLLHDARRAGMTVELDPALEQLVRDNSEADGGSKG